MKTIIPFCLLTLLSGCATILSGSHQSINVQTDPPGAHCEVVRDGKVIAAVDNTPGVINIEKTKNDMNVWCKKDGFAESHGNAQSGNDGMTLGNIVIGGLVGWGVDSALGSDNKYPEQVMINLQPKDKLADGSAKLELLKKAREQGLLTKKEYAAKRAAIIKQL